MIVVEQHEDCFVAYPIGLKGTVVGQGATHDEALAHVNSAIRFHIETFGAEAFGENFPGVDTFLAEGVNPT